MTTDYLAMVKANPETDRVDHGVKGQRWGVTRSREEKDAGGAAPKVGLVGKLKAKAAGAVKSTIKEAPENETSSERYTRLLGNSRIAGPNHLTDEDLKFVTARGNAINQVNKLNQQKPSWLQDIVTEVLKSSAEQSLTTATTKYI